VARAGDAEAPELPAVLRLAGAALADPSGTEILVPTRYAGG
jgi:hypothetical protein